MPTSRQANRAARLGALLVVLGAALLAGCGPERLIGPSISIRNDSPTSVVIRIRQEKWAIGPAETRRFFPPYVYAPDGATIDILDGASCEVLTTFAVSFETDLDPLVTVSANGPPVQSVVTDEDEGKIDRAVQSQNLCERPADGWTVAIVNADNETYYLMANDEAGEPLRGYYAKVLPNSTAVVRLYAGENAAAGALVLADTNCSPLDEVDHAAWGTYVMTIEDAKATIEKGPIPGDSWGSDFGASCPRPAPSPQQSAGG